MGKLVVTKASPHQPELPPAPAPRLPRTKPPAQGSLVTEERERVLQTKCHQNYLTWIAPDLVGLGWMNKNDGKKNIVAASLDKAQGLTAGVPDWQLAIPARGFYGLFVEFKTATGTLSAEQIERHYQLTSQGYLVVIIRKLQEFSNLLAWYLGSPRYRLQPQNPTHVTWQVSSPPPTPIPQTATKPEL